MGKCHKRKLLQNAGPNRKVKKSQAALYGQKQAAPFQGSKTQKSNPTNSKKHVAPPVNPIIPFGQEDDVLLVGEGNFSFALALVICHSPRHLTATCFDSAADLEAKYPQAERIIAELESYGANVVYSVDATRLDQGKKLVRRRKAEGKDTNANAGNEVLDASETTEIPRSKVKQDKWDKIAFNFPHVGGKTKDVNRQVRHNQELLVSFFKSAIPLLRRPKLNSNDSGERSAIVVTLFESEPYTLWNIRDLARHVGLKVEKSFRFVASAYPGYTHARTLGNIIKKRKAHPQSDGDEDKSEDGDNEHAQAKEAELPERPGWRGEERPARTYIFEVDEGQGRSSQHRSSRGKRKGRESSDDESDD